MRPPAFQFFPSDWLSSQRVQMMSLEEEGAYVRLLCYCWNHGSIPADPAQASRLIGKGASTTLAAVVLTMFQADGSDPSILKHARLEQERAKQEQWQAKSSAGGQKSAANRKQKREAAGDGNSAGSTVVEPPLQGALENGGNQKATFQFSSSSLEEEQEKENAPVPPAVGEPPISLDAVKKVCGQFSATEEMACQWWLANDARGWLLDDGRPLARWQSSLTKWANSWRSRDSRAALAAVPGQRPAGSTRTPAPARKAVQTFEPSPDAFETEDPFAAARRNRERLQRERDGEPPPGWDDATAQPQSATA